MKAIHYISLLLVPFLIMGMVENIGDGAAGFAFIVIIGCLITAWKTAEEDSYLKLLGKNIIKEFRSRKDAQKEKMKQNLKD